MRRRYASFTSWPNLGNFVRTQAMSKTAEPWSLTSLREKLIKIRATVTSRERYVTFEIPEVAVSRRMFAGIMSADRAAARIAGDGMRAAGVMCASNEGGRYASAHATGALGVFLPSSGGFNHLLLAAKGNYRV